MCTGGIARSGLGRVVYALATEQFVELNPTGAWPAVPQEGPALFAEASAPIAAYYRT
jgi:tRNA(Arg) A34 adenosine deaminase TadA